MPTTLVRRGRALLLAGLALGASAALAACGSLQFGAAAIAGSQAITTAMLTGQVSDLNSAYHADAHRVQLAFPAAQIPEQVLSWLIRFRVRDEMASRQHVYVSPAQVQAAITDLSRQASESGGGQTLTDLAVANGLPPDLISPDLGRYQAIANDLIARIDGGITPTSASAQASVDAVFNRDQCLAAKALAIRVNPQFGRLDYSDLGVVTAANTLSAPGGVSPSRSSTATPQYRPPC